MDKKVMMVLLLAAFIFASCQKKCDLPGFGIGSGDILANALVSVQLVTAEMRSQGIVINSEEENWFDLKVSFDNGGSYSEIDFDQYTVLGKYAEGQCTTAFERVVNSQGNVHVYTIRVHQCGKCESLITSMNWVLVPKVPEDHEVQFLVYS
jgi:hypothetical protein